MDAARLAAFRRRSLPELRVVEPEELRGLLGGARAEQLPYLLDSDPQALGHAPGTVLAGGGSELYLVVRSRRAKAE
jgi:DNA-directed RNA polymerase subunit H (RpoH/RPB5)